MQRISRDGGPGHVDALVLKDTVEGSIRNKLKGLGKPDRSVHHWKALD